MNRPEDPQLNRAGCRCSAKSWDNAHADLSGHATEDTIIREHQRYGRAPLMPGELPMTALVERVHPGHTALLIVDVQNTFVHPDSLAVPSAMRRRSRS